MSMTDPSLRIANEQRLLRLEAAESRRQSSEKQRQTMEEWRRASKTLKVVRKSTNDMPAVHKRHESLESCASRAPQTVQDSRTKSEVTGENFPESSIQVASATSVDVEVGDFNLALVTLCSIAKKGDPAKENFADQIRSTAKLAWQLKDHTAVVSSIDHIFNAATNDKNLDMRAAFYVVEKVLKDVRATYLSRTQKQHDCDMKSWVLKAREAALGRACMSHLTGWLESLLRHARSESGHKKALEFVTKLFESGWIDDSDQLKLLNVARTKDVATSNSVAVEAAPHLSSDACSSSATFNVAEAAAADADVDEFAVALATICSIAPNADKATFSDSLKKVARLALSITNVSHVVSNLDNLINTAATDKNLDMRAALYVVELILRERKAASVTVGNHTLAPRGRGGASGMHASSQDADQTALQQALSSRLMDWLRLLMLNPKSTKSLEKARQLVTRLFDSGSLPEDDARQLLNIGVCETSAAAKENAPPSKRQRLCDISKDTSFFHQTTNVNMANALRKDTESSSSSATASATDDAQPFAKRSETTGGDVSATSTTASASTDEPLPQVRRVLGDCRCMFRAICCAIDDPDNTVARNEEGEPLAEVQRARELARAEDLRARTCAEMQLRRAEVAALLGEDEPAADVYITSMQDWTTWGDAICLHFLASLVGRPIQVYAFNVEQKKIFDSGMYLPRDLAQHSAQAIVLWYNGQSHYDLISNAWLRQQEKKLIC